MHRTLIYARVSTEDQVEKYGLPVQLRACREHAEKQGWQIAAELSDDGISGSLIERPSLDKLRQVVRDGGADIVLMYDVDRLSRELVHLLILKPEIEKRARLEFVAGKFEDSPLGRLFFNLRGSIAQFEREQTRERTMRGKREKARTGLVVGGGRVAYGLVFKDGKLLPDPERAEFVRQIFGWFDAGISMRSITLRLRESGVPTWTGRRWGHSSVRRILVNETYAGMAYFGTHRREGNVLRLRAPQERIAVPVEPLIDSALWRRVQGRVEHNVAAAPHGGSGGGRPSADYLLRGLLYCACGQRMHGQKEHRNGRVYRCAGRDSVRHRGADRCHERINATKMDAAVWQEVMRVFADRAALRTMLREHEEALRVPENPVRLAQLTQQARKLKGREEAALSLMLDPDLVADRATLKQQYRQAQMERQRIESELKAAERAAGAFQVGWIDETVALLGEYVSSLEDAVDRQQFVRGIVSRADWSRAGEVALQCFIGSEPVTTS